MTASELYQNIFNKDWFRSCCGDFLENMKLPPENLAEPERRLANEMLWKQERDKESG